mgnify:CR=1 FL=1
MSWRGQSVVRFGVWILGSCTFMGLMAGCSDAPPTAHAGPATSETSVHPPTTSSASPPTTPETPKSALTKQEAVLEVQAYLDAWRTDGLAAANERYLVPDQHAAGETGPRLAHGSVTKVAQTEVTPDGMVMLATLTLNFDGDSGAWGNGANDRWITFTWRGGSVPYVMSFATSP